MSSLSPEPRRFFEYLFSRNNLSIHDRDRFDSIDFTILIEFDDSFDVDMLSFGFTVGVIRIQVTTELFDTLLNIKRRVDWDGRRPFDVSGIHCKTLLTDHKECWLKLLRWVIELSSEQIFLSICCQDIQPIGQGAPWPIRSNLLCLEPQCRSANWSIPRSYLDLGGLEQAESQKLVSHNLTQCC